MDRFSAALLDLSNLLRVDRDLVDEDYDRLIEVAQMPEDDVVGTRQPDGTPANLPPPPEVPNWDDGTTLGESAEAIVEALETPAALVAVPDPLAIPHLLEQNLAAFRQNLSALLTVRAEFTSLAKEYLEFRLRVEEFNRLDAINRFERAEGVHEQDFLDAREELAWISSRTLTSVEEVVRHGVHETLPPILGMERRDQLQEMSATASFVNLYVSRGTLVARERNLKRRKELAYQDIATRRYRIAVARDAMAVRYREFMRGGSALNFLPRLRAMKKLYETQLQRALSLTEAIRQGAIAFYQLPIEAPALQPGSAGDELGSWLVEVGEGLRRARQLEQTAIYTVWASENQDEWKEQLSHGLDLNVMLPLAGRPHRLRGVAVESSGDYTDTLAVTVEPPTEAPAWPNALPQGHLPTLTLGRVQNDRLVPQPAFEHGPILWNAGANGIWRIRLAHHADLDDVSDVALRLLVAF